MSLHEKLLALLPISAVESDPILAPVNYTPIRGTCGCGTGAPSSHMTFQVPANSDLKVSDWIPIANPEQGELWHGVERYLDRLRLAGVVYHAHHRDSLENQYVTGSACLNREGGIPDYVFAPGDLYMRLANVKERHGSPKLIPCDNLEGEIVLIQLNTWKRYSHTLVCEAPGFNCRIILP